MNLIADNFFWVLFLGGCPILLSAGDYILERIIPRRWTDKLLGLIGWDK